MANLKQATKKSIQESKVQQLDNLGTDVNEFIQKESLSIVENVLGDFVERVHDNINKADLPVTGKISDIELRVEENAVSVYAPKHLLYIDRGVNGAKEKRFDTPHFYSNKRPPIAPFVAYVKAKNLRLKDNEKYKGKASPFKELTEDEKITNAAWAMSTKVYQYGIKPRNIFGKEIPQLVSDLKAQIKDFTIQCIKQRIAVKDPAKRVVTP